jgi:hypothetical protein
MSTDSEEDQVINDLLDELDEEESELTPEPEVPSLQLIGGAPEPTHDPQQITIAPDVDSPAASVASSGGDSGKLIEALLGVVEARTADIWGKVNADRALIDKYLEIFTTRINQPEDTKGYYVEALVSLVNTKAATSMNATKILDSTAKIVATIKNIGVENSTNVDLEKLLESDSDASFKIDIDNP